MIKKNVLLTLVLAGLTLGVTMSLSSCKKAETAEESTPVVQELLRNAGDHVTCAHCLEEIYDRTYAPDPYGPEYYHEHYYGPGFVSHPKFNGLQCPIVNCRHRTKNHIHIVVYYTEGSYDHYQDDWIHVGGGAGGQ